MTKVLQKRWWLTCLVLVVCSLSFSQGVQATYQSAPIDLRFSQIRRLSFFFDGDLDEHPSYASGFFTNANDEIYWQTRPLNCESVSERTRCEVEINFQSGHRFFVYRLSQEPTNIQAEVEEGNLIEEVEAEHLEDWRGRIFYSSIREIPDPNMEWVSFSFEQTGGYLLNNATNARPHALVFDHDVDTQLPYGEDVLTVEIEFKLLAYPAQILKLSEEMDIYVDENLRLRIGNDWQNTRVWLDGRSYDGEEIIIAHNESHILTITTSSAAVIGSEAILPTRSEIDVFRLKLFNEMFSSKEVLATHLHDKIMIQSRSSDDGINWSEWSGGWDEDVDEINKAQVSFVPSESGEAQIVLRGRSVTGLQSEEFLVDVQTWQVAENFALGVAEEVARGNREIKLAGNSFGDLQIGETLVATEVRGESVYIARSTIIDLDRNNMIVVVSDWLGAVPRLSSPDENNNQFGFSTEARLARMYEFFMDVPMDWLEVIGVNVVDENGEDIEVLDFRIGRIVTPACSSGLNESVCVLGLIVPVTSPQGRYLQYRLIFGDRGDNRVHNVGVNVGIRPDVDNSFSSRTPGRLRHGKTFDNGFLRPFYWNR
ncbi:MAG: hypothetical protein LBG64_01225 [Pseudomonadales bacterium]|jgi:hypothetical protein|nr:hypothetical protein [Pseudomonadales bacterium]